ncbi:MAG: hypothetical protein A2007_04390 [Verrucomicrobia bacterium GWC2_42_7]|nr:MAG: hypothetical protein A2007_04390 [Verrucomicrobia bacterium GWC2_42_7]
MREYGLKPDLFESAFYAFRIEKDLGKGRLRLVRCEESLLGSEEMLFALPNSLDEDKSTYADFLDHITKLRVKMLNDMISFEQKLTIEEIEEDIREREQADYLEGKSIHSFKEIIDVVEYVPDGYELDSDEESPGKKSNDEEDIPELGDDYELEEEDIEEDETMKWEEDAEGFHLEDHEDDNSDGLDFSKDDDDDLEDEVEEEEEDLTPRRSKARK